VASRKSDLRADAKAVARQVPDREVAECIEALQAASQSAEGDLKVWLAAALQELERRNTSR
jgi:hypothetical protein